MIIFSVFQSANAASRNRHNNLIFCSQHRAVVVIRVTHWRGDTFSFRHLLANSDQIWCKYWQFSVQR